MLLKLFILFFLSAAFGAEIQLPNGRIRGREGVTLAGTNYFIFEKIPYAKPPVGQLRFKAPQPAEDWEGVLETVAYDTICYQVTSDSDQESEDCLFLNIYTPALPVGDVNPGLPVMLYIYGGGFVEGNCQWCGPDILVNYGVIFVTINYRLGPFGFLSTEDEVIPGNNGLKDQHFAIKWTRDNIALFGGDPDKITIWGQSAGSASVTYQFLNNASRELFRGGICESGSFLSPWAFQRDARKIAFTTAGFIDDSFTNSSDSQALFDFLLDLPATDIDKASNKYAERENVDHIQIVQGYFWAPVIEPEHEGAFITEKMYGQLLKGDIVNVSILIGIDSEEDLFFASNIDDVAYKMEQFDAHLDWLVPSDMRIEDMDEKTEMGEKIRKIYTDGKPFAENLGLGIRYLSDASFTKSLRKHAELQSNFSDVFFYQFSYKGVMGQDDVEIEGAENVAHGDELRYVFHMAWDGYDNANASLFSAEEVKVQARLLTMLTNFAKYLNPTPERSEVMQNILWPRFDTDSYQYVDIGTNLTIKGYPKNETYPQWVELYDSLGFDDFDTY